MMWLPLSTEHEQTLSDSTVYQWNIPLSFPSSLTPSLFPHYHSLCHPLLLCLSFLIGVIPSVSRSIFHFRFNFSDVLSTLLLRHLSLLFCLPLAVCQLCPPHFHEINKPCHMVATCQLSYDIHQHVHYVDLVLI